MLQFLKNKILWFLTVTGIVVIGYAADFSVTEPVITDNAVVGQTEILDERTYSTKTFDNGDGSFTMNSYLEQVHYKNNGTFVNSDITFVDKGTYWEMVAHNYNLRVAKDFGSNQLIQYRNLYEGADHTIVYEPKALGWVNSTDFVDYQVFKTQQSVIGELNVEKNKILFRDAFGAGIDFEVTMNRSGFSKEIVINSKVALGKPPTPQHKLVALFRYTGTGLNVRRNSDKSLWDGINYKDSTFGYQLEESSGKFSIIKPAYIYDSSVIKKSQPIKVFWKRYNGNLYQAKVLPTQFLRDATYPVRADTVTDYYSDAADGAMHSYPLGAWSTERSASAATYIDTTSTILSDGVYGYSVHIRKNGSNYAIARAFLPIDTSGVPDTASISDVVLYLYPTGTTIGDNDAQAYVVVVESTQASATSTVKDDFDQTGTVAWSDKPTLSTINSSVNSAYVPFTFDSTGIAAVNVTGFTLLALREGHDFEDSPTNAGGHNRATFSSSEDTSGTKDPYLEVTYTTGGASVPPAVYVTPIF